MVQNKTDQLILFGVFSSCQQYFKGFEDVKVLHLQQATMQYQCATNVYIFLSIMNYGPFCTFNARRKVQLALQALRTKK